MIVAREADHVVAWAPAKVNLFLEVLSKRGDGYHELETVLVAVSLYDTLVFTEESTGAIQLQCSQRDLSTGPDNLIVRAAELLRRHTGCAKGASIRLAKRIPMAAGLAGGSTDAAAALLGLNLLWSLDRPAAELADLAAKLGSDVPFFLAPTPAAWCTGRGEMVTPLPVPKPLWFVLVAPPVGLKTAEVYGRLKVPEKPVAGDAIRRALTAGDVKELGRCLHNRLQEPATLLQPTVARWQARLASLKPAGALMSGSGSSLFALCRDRIEARRLAEALRNDPDENERPRVFLVRSCS